MEKVIIAKQTGTTLSVSVIFAYLGINERVMYLYGTLLIMDFITGTIRAGLQKELSSRKAIHGFFSKLTIIFLILSVGIFGKILNYDMEFILSSIFSALSLAELYSIIGNTYEIRTGKKVKEYDAVAVLLSKALGFVKVKLDKIEPNQNKDDSKK